MSKDEALRQNDQLIFESGIGLEWQELTKTKIALAVDQITAQVQEGNIDPLNTLLQIKKGKALFDSLEKKIRPLAEEKMSLARGEVLQQHSCEITQAETGVEYDFSVCNDPVWIDLSDELDLLTKKLQDREKFLKSLSEPMNIITEHGEPVTVQPPVKKGKLGLKISIK